MAKALIAQKLYFVISPSIDTIILRESEHNLMYEKRITHQGLRAFRVIRHSDPDVVELKAKMQLLAWEERWLRVQQAESKRQQKQQISFDIAASKSEARRRSEECQRAILQVERTLLDSIELDHCLNWEALKDRRDFSIPKPTPQTLGNTPAPPDPRKYAPRFRWFEHLASPVKRRKREQADQKFREAERTWSAAKQEVEQENAGSTAQYQEAVRQWEFGKLAFRAQQVAQHNEIASSRERYVKKDPEALQEYWESILNNSEYPDSFPKSFLLEYLRESRILIVEYALPQWPVYPPSRKLNTYKLGAVFKRSSYRKLG